MSQMNMIIPTDTTVGEIHEFICDTAVEIANSRVLDEKRIPKRWRGPAFMNGAPYNEGRLVILITQEYQGATERTKEYYRRIALSSVKSAIVHHGELFAGLVLGEAKMGRNYFDMWPQAPTTLF